MVAQYTILGRQFGSHQLAIATLSFTFLGAYLGLRGGSKPQQVKPPSTNARSKEEEEFIQEFLKNVNEEEQKTKH